MPRNMTKDFQFVAEKPDNLSVEQRILLFAYLRDTAAGRTGSAADAYEDLREAVFMFSSGFVHFTEVAYYNISYWREFEEYEVGAPAPEHVGYARSTVGSRTSFNMAIRRLVRSKEAWAFTDGVRALKGLGQKTTPLLQIWSEANHNKPRDILAYSLRETGFARARQLATKHKQIVPWRIHEKLVQDREFSKALTGKG
jgi:hypothetical protein